VPNILLQTDWPINVYAYCGDYYTKEHAIFKVNRRSRPDDYVYTETEVKRWEALEKRVNETLDTVAEAEHDRAVAEYNRGMAEVARTHAEEERAETFDRLAAELQTTIDGGHTDVENFNTEATSALGNFDTQAKELINNTNTTVENFITKAGTDIAYMIEDGYLAIEDFKAEAATLIENTNNTIAELVDTTNATVAELVNEGEAVIEELSNYDSTIDNHGNRIAANEVKADNHDKRITNIERHISNDYFVTDETTEYNKLVPVDACPYAEVSKIGGMTRKCNNLIPYPYVPHIISNGITFTDNGDGSITINGQSNGNNPSVFYMHRREYPITIKAGTYFNSGNLAMTLFGLDGKYTSFGYKKATTTEADITGGLYIQVSKNDTTVYENFVVYPMLNYGSSEMPYEPYFEGLRDAAVSELKSEGADNTVIDTLEISEELRTFLADKGYGRGVEGYPNYIDFDRKVFVKNTYRKVFDGTENLILASTTSATGGLYRFQFILPYKSVFEGNNKAVPLICNLYNTVSGDATWKGVTGVSITNGTSIHFFDTNYQTVDEYKAHLAELYANGNPLVVEYALAEPIETDISAYLDNDSFIEVEGGGSIRAINEYNNPAPTSITYLLKEGSI
jgi:hypothetical protein